MGGRRVSVAVGAEHVYLTAHRSLRCVRFNHAMGTNNPNENGTGETKEKQVNKTNRETVLGKRAGEACCCFPGPSGAGERGEVYLTKSPRPQKGKTHKTHREKTKPSIWLPAA